MTAEIILECFYDFADSRTSHQVIERMGSRLLTACGHSFRECDAKKQRHRQCGNCKKYKRDFFKP